MQDFWQLTVWSKAHALAVNVRNEVRRFPRNGYSSLKAQMTGSAESIVFNIVEGSAANGQRDFAGFLDISIKSSTELEYQLELAKAYGVLPMPAWESLSSSTVEIRRMLCGLRKSILAAAEAEEKNCTTPADVLRTVLPATHDTPLPN